jgi:hypothetical protein
MKLHICKYIILLLLAGFHFTRAWGNNQQQPINDLTFEFYYETLIPLKLQSATLYTLPSALAPKRDSIAIKIDAATDTFALQVPWKFPVNAMLLLKYEDLERKSNNFLLDPNRKYWQVFVSDTAAMVHSQPRFSFQEKGSFSGIIILIQGAIELLLALMFYKFFRWPSWTLLVVLVANVASFPVYLLGLTPDFLGDLLMIGIEFLVMLLISRRKLGIWRIIILVLTLNIISFGFKEIFFLVTSVL